MSSLRQLQRESSTALGKVAPSGRGTRKSRFLRLTVVTWYCRSALPKQRGRLLFEISVHPLSQLHDKL